MKLDKVVRLPDWLITQCAHVFGGDIGSQTFSYVLFSEVRESTLYPLRVEDSNSQWKWIKKWGKLKLTSKLQKLLLLDIKQTWHKWVPIF